MEECPADKEHAMHKAQKQNREGPGQDLPVRRKKIMHKRASRQRRPLQALLVLWVSKDQFLSSSPAFFHYRCIKLKFHGGPGFGFVQDELLRPVRGSAQETVVRLVVGADIFCEPAS